MNKLGINISHDTVIRILRRLPENFNKIDETVTNIGVDDFAFRKGKDYCTLICDMDQRTVLEILPSRNKKDLMEWLKRYPQIKLVSRDGSITYASAIGEALPKAKQVSDRFHLIKNLLDAVSQYIKRKYPRKLIISDATVGLDNDELANQVDKTLIDTSNIRDKIREEKITNKWNLMLEIKEKHKKGISLRQLAKEYSMSRTSITKYIEAEEPIYWPKGKTKASKLDPYKEFIVELLDKGNSQEEILNILKERGYGGSKSLISAYINKHKLKKNISKKKQTNNKNNNKKRIEKTSIHTVIKLICKNNSNLTRDEICVLKKLKERYHELISLKELIDNFKSMFSGKG